MNLGRHSVRLNFTFSVMYVKTVVIFFILLALGRCSFWLFWFCRLVCQLSNRSPMIVFSVGVTTD
jgi:hypothetical protein